MKIFYVILSACMLTSSVAKAQLAAQKDAAYFATLKAVTDFKINDEENAKELASLRENAKFNKKLAGMMKKLSNNRNKDSKNSKIYKILLKAGKDIYNELN